MDRLFELISEARGAGEASRLQKCFGKPASFKAPFAV
jgi:hypothetical protein